MGGKAVANLYVHFPFCRRKCTYCALYSRAGVPSTGRAAYVARLADALGEIPDRLSTVYFGGGSPALCDLRPLLSAIGPKLGTANGLESEFTVELHPLDVTRETLETLRAGGVNRISMGVQSLDDATLRHMARGYTADDAKRAFALVRKYFSNAGIDMIVGYPRPAGANAAAEAEREFARLGDWGLAHCSVYSLILEERSILAKKLAREDCGGLAPATDDEMLDGVREAARALAAIGLERYEISNYALPGRECKHNLAVWRGEDYIGLGEGAHGRIGLLRTRNWMGSAGCGAAETETVGADFDAKERRLFRLRTREGLDATGHPEWRKTLDSFTGEGLLTNLADGIYRLTARGAEVCDSILAELV